MFQDKAFLLINTIAVLTQTVVTGIMTYALWGPGDGPGVLTCKNSHGRLADTWDSANCLLKFGKNRITLLY